MKRHLSNASNKALTLTRETMKFRIAKKDDMQILNTISVKSKRHWGYPESLIEKWKDELTLNEEKFFALKTMVIEVKGQIVGFCSIAENKENYEILHLWLLPKYIGLGYGKKLLGEAIKYFVKENKPIIVESDPNAEEFYKSQGFVTFDKAESFPKGRFLPIMRKTVQPKD